MSKRICPKNLSECPRLNTVQIQHLKLRREVSIKHIFIGQFNPIMIGSFLFKIGDTMKRAAIYARVSTKNNGQNPETQLTALRDFVHNRGWTLTGEYVDHGVSGAKDRRPQLDLLMKDVRTRRIDVVVVARFDRFARST